MKEEKETLKKEKMSDADKEMLNFFAAHAMNRLCDGEFDFEQQDANNCYVIAELMLAESKKY